jgi:hypothetical protein
MVAENASFCCIFLPVLSLSLSPPVLVLPTDYTPIPIDDTEVTTSSDYEPLWLENKRFGQRSTRAV